TGIEARTYVHELRSQHQAVMIGAGTLRKDNPKLNVRLPDYQGEQPWRIVFTNSGNLPSDRDLFTDELKHKTLVFSKNKTTVDLPASQIFHIASLSEPMDILFE